MKKTNIIALALCAACFLSSCAYSGVTDETTTDSDIVSSEITSESTQKETVTEKTSQTTSKTTSQTTSKTTSKTTTNATTTKSTVTEEVTTKAEEKEEIAYILNINSMKFHATSCRHVESIKEENKKEFTGNREDLIKDGYTPCGTCKP